jgi:hypothetical protein
VFKERGGAGWSSGGDLRSVPWWSRKGRGVGSVVWDL